MLLEARVTVTEATGAGWVEVTVTAAIAVVLPTEFVAVSVYVVVAGGLTAVLDPVTVPIPWSIDTDVAPVTLHARVDEPPGAMLEGVALNDAITGAAGGGGLVPPVSELPPHARINVLATMTAKTESLLPMLGVVTNHPGVGFAASTISVQTIEPGSADESSPLHGHSGREGEMLYLASGAKCAAAAR